MLARRSSFTLAIAASALIATACGSSSGSSSNGEAKKTGPQVVKDAAAALSGAGAVHFAGTMTDSSTKQPISADLHLQSDGTSGSLTVAGQKVDLITVGGVTYVKTSAAFFVAQKVPAAAAAKLANRWVKLPSSSDFDSLTLSGISKSLEDPESNSPVEQKVSTDKLDGQSVVIVKQSDGSELFVAGSGKPYPLKTVNSAKSKDGAGTVTLTDYGKHISIKAPAGALDLTGAAA